MARRGGNARAASGCKPRQQPAPAFCELAARFSLAKSELGSTVPRKMGLNWFMPALLQGGRFQGAA